MYSKGPGPPMKIWQHKSALECPFDSYFSFYKTLLPSCRSDILVWQPMSELCLFYFFFDDQCVNLMVCEEQNTRSPVLSTCGSILRLKDMIRNIEEILLRLILECFFLSGTNWILNMGWKNDENLEIQFMFISWVIEFFPAIEGLRPLYISESTKRHGIGIGNNED